MRTLVTTNGNYPYGVSSTPPTPITSSDTAGGWYDNANGNNNFTVGDGDQLNSWMSDFQQLLSAGGQNQFSGNLLSAVKGLTTYSNSTLSGSGYLKLPNGVMFQWAQVSAMGSGTSGEQTTTFNFPTAFSSTVFTCMISFYGVTPQANAALAVQAISTTQYEVTVANGAAIGLGCNVWAIGI